MGDGTNKVKAAFKNGNFQFTVPLIVVIAVCVVGWNAIHKSLAANTAGITKNTETIKVQAVKVESVQRQLDRMESKLDRLVERGN